MTPTICIYISDDVEVLDFAIPYEVFTTAARIHLRVDASSPPIFQVATIGSSLDTVRARAGLKLNSDFTIHTHPKLDCLIAPGGVITTEPPRPQVISWLTQQMQQVDMAASVCTGAFLLAKTRCLNGLEVITNWKDIPDSRAAFPMVLVREEDCWTDIGSIVKNAGISAGIDEPASS